MPLVPVFILFILFLPVLLLLSDKPATGYATER